LAWSVIGWTFVASGVNLRLRGSQGELGESTRSGRAFGFLRANIFDGRSGVNERSR
jgi:hypothetical protein